LNPRVPTGAIQLPAPRHAAAGVGRPGGWLPDASAWDRPMFPQSTKHQGHF